MQNRKLGNSNSFDYLKDLFTRLPAAKITQIKEFTPGNKVSLIPP